LSTAKLLKLTVHHSQNCVGALTHTHMHVHTYILTYTHKTQGARRLANRQSLMGIDESSVELRLFPYQLDSKLLWDAMASMDALEKVGVAGSPMCW